MRRAAISSASRFAGARLASAASISEAESSRLATLSARTRSKRTVYWRSAASRRSRTSARIAAAAASTASSCFASNAVSRASAASKPGADESSRVTASSAMSGGRNCLDQRLHLFALELEGCWIHDQSRTDRADLFDGDEIVGLERVAGAHQIDDRIGEPHQRRQ